MSIIDVIWSPYNDKFITFGNDLKLYQLKHINDEPNSSGYELSETFYANVIATNTDVQFVKCIACHPKGIHLDTDVLLAAGQTSGKVILTSFQYNIDGSSLIGKEFSPKHARQCNCVDWSPNENSLLAVGYDKFRADNAVIIWDINKPIDYQADRTAGQTPKPLQEFALGEVVSSLKWFAQQNRVLVCGMNNKQLKIYDLRDSGKPKIIPTKAVYGIALDPFNDYRFASYFENHQFVWDSRNFKKPLTNLEPESKMISKLEWCPTRQNLLAALFKDSFALKLYDIQDAPVNSDCDPTVIERVINPFQVQSKNTLNCFTWHPTHESRMIIVTSLGVLHDFTVVDPITLNWSPSSEIIWTHGKKLLQCIDSRDQFYENLDDIAVTMRNRALQGYGINPNKTWQLFSDDSPLYNVWKWISHAKHTDKNIEALFKSLSIKNRDDDFPNALNGVCSILIQSSDKFHHSLNTRSEKTFLNSIELISSYVSSTKSPAIYKSDDRQRALQLCNWDSNFDISNVNTKFIEQLESKQKWSRAAAISIFYYRIKRAIQTLKKASELSKEKGGDPYLGPISVALSGYSKDKNLLWKEMCLNFRHQLTDSYLKAIFTFLTCDNDSYSEILNDHGILLSDRVAFACIYLSDSTLCDYLTNLTRQSIDSGDLNGLILTGITNEGIDLFERYIEKTSDVQTVSLILLECLPNPIYKNIKAELWIDSYKSLLDRWRLWNLRALFDNEWYKGLAHQEEPKQQIYVRCNYCSSPISSYIKSHQQNKPQDMQLQPHHRQSYNRNLSVNAQGNKTRIQSCPTCRKPLPRCALCLTQLGTPAGSYWRHSELTFSDKDSKLTPFDSWFTWCQTCRHGGHASHIIEWFNQHVECPVSGCSCKCMSLDSTAKISISA